jgi:hypothetical protein
MKTQIVAALVALAVTLGTTVVAQQTFIPAPTAVRRGESLRPPTGTQDTRIIGSVIDITQTPVAFARVQLRDLLLGAVEQKATSDDNGEYEFTVDDPSTYVVEMVRVDGFVVAVSNAATVGRYETMQTVVQLPGRWDAATSRVLMRPGVSNFFGMGAHATMTAGTLQLASDLNIPTSDPGEPVSP